MRPLRLNRARVALVGCAAAAAQQPEGGFLTNLLNPSIASLYLVVVPQFVPRGAPVVPSVLLITLIHVWLALTWHLVWAAGGGTLSRLIALGPARGVLDSATGWRCSSWRPGCGPAALKTLDNSQLPQLQLPRRTPYVPTPKGSLSN